MKSSPALCQRKIISAMMCATAAFAVTASNAYAVQGVEITGTNTDFGTMTYMAGNAGISKQQLCADAAPGAADTVTASTDSLKQRMTPRFGDAASDLQSLSRDDVMESMSEICQDPEDSSTAPFKIIYASCRMTMDSADQLLDIVLPPGGAAGRMDMVDFNSQEVFHVGLQRKASAAETAISGGWGSAIDMDSGSDGGSVAGHATRKYNFEYSGGFGGGGNSPMAAMASVKNTGTVWIADGMDGIDTVRSFYTNMTREIDPAQAEQGIVSGLINNLVKMLQNGMPMRMKQTMESTMMGMAVTGSRSHMEVYRSQEIDLPADWCAQNFVPEGFTVRDIDQEISEAMSGMGGQDSGDGAGMSEMQQQLNDAMQHMTPEQQEMMKSMGMGALQQMMGGAANSTTNCDSTSGSDRDSENCTENQQ